MLVIQERGRNHELVFECMFWKEKTVCVCVCERERDSFCEVCYKHRVVWIQDMGEFRFLVAEYVFVCVCV